MFDHIIIFLSFIFAMAMTKLLSSASDIVSARRRVRFSALYMLWLLVAALGLIVSWLGDRTLLLDLKVWKAADFALVLSSAVIQYFFCSLLAIKIEPEGTVDLDAYLDQERPAIFTVAAVLDAVALFMNYFESPHTHGQSSSTWMVADLFVFRSWSRR